MNINGELNVYMHLFLTSALSSKRSVSHPGRLVFWKEAPTFFECKGKWNLKQVWKKGINLAITET
jgi:hypothetical protein